MAEKQRNKQGGIRNAAETDANFACFSYLSRQQSRRRIPDINRATASQSCPILSCSTVSCSASHASCHRGHKQ